MHKLAAIIGMLGTNKYVPPIFGPIRIGTSSNWKCIPFSQFCYAVLTNKEQELPTQLQLEPTSWKLSISPNVLGKFEPFLYFLEVSGTKIFDPDDPVEKENERANEEPPKKKRRTNAVDLVVLEMDDRYGLSRVRTNKYGQVIRKSLIGKKELKRIEMQLIGSKDEIRSAYDWSPEDGEGWCPSFFNASFVWLCDHRVVTAYNQVRRLIVCTLRTQQVEF